MCELWGLPQRSPRLAWKTKFPLIKGGIWEEKGELLAGRNLPCILAKAIFTGLGPQHAKHQNMHLHRDFIETISRELSRSRPRTLLEWDEPWASSCVSADVQRRDVYLTG